jgi:hypothetical protein
MPGTIIRKEGFHLSELPVHPVSPNVLCMVEIGAPAPVRVKSFAEHDSSREPLKRPIMGD